MTRSERRLLLHTSVLGLLLTLMVMALEWSGNTATFERFFYDFRARHFQYFTPPPTDKLVHIDIDDRSLETIGNWPWPRSRMAEIIDEIRLAGAGALALDVIYSEPQGAGYEEVAGRGGPATGPATRPSGGSQTVLARRIDHDAVLAESLRKFGHAIVPVSFNLNIAQPSSPHYFAIVKELTADMELEPQQVLQRLEARGLRGSIATDVRTWFLTARREAMFDRISAEATAGANGLDELRARILPRLDPQITGSPQLRILAEQYERYEAVQAMRRFSRPIEPGFPPLLTTRDEQATVRAFMNASYTTGFVDYVPMADGIVRRVPMWINHRGRMYPQMGFALACAMLKVNPRDVRIETDRIVIPRPEGDLVVPVHMQQTARGRFGTFLDVPWFGRAGSGAWETMYDYPAYKRPKQHVAIQYIWEACQYRQRIAHNNLRILDALIFLLGEIDLKQALALAKSPPHPDDVATYTKLAETTLAKLKRDGTVEFWKEMDPKDLSNDDRERRQKMLTVPESLAMLVQQSRGIQNALAERRTDLRAQLGGKACLIGYIAVGAIADVVPTSMHPQCPGVVIHGVIFNSIMTGRFWRPVGKWVTLLLTLLGGIATTAIVARLNAWKALAAAAALAAGYFIINALLLFDRYELLVGLASPLTAVAVVWSGGTLVRFILEAAERRKVEAHFRNYVDPALTDYLMERDDVRLDGQLKEMTVVFTDLQGFTTLSEKLREETVPLLNQYMARMVPIIRQRRGYLNKLLGDGIMFFFSAPRDNPLHALDAVGAVLEMQDAMVDFNRSLAERGLPTLVMRAGVGCGFMVVGDCGPSDRSFADYTVLGDTVNLASRLEGANKAFGSRILVNERCRELVGDRVIFRPIGRIQVKGKQEGVMAYEPLELAEHASEQYRQLARLTENIVLPFMAGQFERCLAGVAAMESEVGESKLTAMYASMSRIYLAQAPAAGFNGQIVLTEK